MDEPLARRQQKEALGERDVTYRRPRGGAEGPKVTGQLQINLYIQSVEKITTNCVHLFGSYSGTQLQTKTSHRIPTPPQERPPP